MADSEIADFTGFKDEAFAFLKDLAANNDRVWFERNRSRYTEFLLEPARGLVVAIGERLEEFAPGAQFEPRVDGSIVRLNRDTRFSGDKTPYKTHLDLFFWEGADKRSWSLSGFFFRLTAERVFLGAGILGFDKPFLAAYREAVADPIDGSALLAAVSSVQQAGPYEIGGDAYKRVPSGYDPDHERADWLKRKGLHAAVEGPVPHNIYTRKFVDYCVGHFKNLDPLHKWLVGVANR